MTAAQLRAIAVLSGGAVGALARVAVAETIPHHAGEWPWATFTVNLLGALVLAWLTVRLAGPAPSLRYWRLALGTGFCGALTTFSTFQVETVELAGDGHAATAAGYAIVSIAAGLAAAVAGTAAARRRHVG